jgi:hypothetical protein
MRLHTGLHATVPATGHSAVLRTHERALRTNRNARREMTGVRGSSRDRTRTCDPVINSHLLYQLSYAGMDRET